MPRIDSQIAIGALAASKVKSTALGSVLDQEVWAISMDTNSTLTNIVLDEGPILFGVCHSDYSDVEIEEWLEEASSWIKSNKIGQERSRRKCRLIGSLMYDAIHSQFNGGRNSRTKLGWALEDGMTLKFWVYNQSDSTLTTGGTLNTTGKAFLRPV